MDRFIRKDDFNYLKEKYPYISFHLYHDITAGRLAQVRYLFGSEGYITVPHTYHISTIQKIGGLITYNGRFKKSYGSHCNIISVNGYPDWNNYYKLEDNEFVTYDKKINGVCSLNKIYHTGKTGDIVYLRKNLFNSLSGILKHSYGPVAYGGGNYQGPGGSPSSKESLVIINKYKFNLALEPMYHPMWSYDWVTERMWNCFRAKTIPVYFGGYNIEDHVPTDLFIDLRKYLVQVMPKITFDTIRLVEDLNNISKDQYIDMTEKGYEWQKNNRLGNIEDIIAVLETLK